MNIGKNGCEELKKSPAIALAVNWASDRIENLKKKEQCNALYYFLIKSQRLEDFKRRLRQDKSKEEIKKIDEKFKEIECRIKEVGKDDFSDLFREIRNYYSHYNYYEEQEGKTLIENLQDNENYKNSLQNIFGKDKITIEEYFKYKTNNSLVKKLKEKLSKKLFHKLTRKLSISKKKDILLYLIANEYLKDNQNIELGEDFSNMDNKQRKIYYQIKQNEQTIKIYYQIQRNEQTIKIPINLNSINKFYTMYDDDKLFSFITNYMQNRYESFDDICKKLMEYKEHQFDVIQYVFTLEKKYEAEIKATLTNESNNKLTNESVNNKQFTKIVKPILIESRIENVDNITKLRNDALHNGMCNELCESYTGVFESLKNP
jgi:hypothetical protein